MKNQSYILVCSCCLLFMLSFKVNAQRIYFSDTTNEWRMSQAGEMGPDGFSIITKFGYYASDTLVESGGRYYTEIKLSGGGPNWYFGRTLIREDTATGLVYIKPHETNSGVYDVTDTNEFVYLNYNLNLGDTLIMPLVFSWNHADSISIHVVTETDTFIVNGIAYKKFKFEVYGGMAHHVPAGEDPTKYTVYEGIGPGSGPIIEPHNVGEYAPPWLDCFRNQGSIIPKFSTNCYPVTIEELAKKIKHFLYYPNPALDKLTIKGYEQSDKACTVKISDLQGKVLLETKFKIETVLDVEHFTAGIYILQFIINKAVIQSDKLIIRR